MVQKFFYMYSRSKIQQLFPQVDLEKTATSDFGIKRGWCPSMLQYVNSIHPICREYPDGTVELGDNPWYYDIRLGEILNVDSKITEGYFCLNKDGDKYYISKFKCKDTIGGILNRPYAPEQKKQSRLAIMLAKRKEKTYGKMAISNGTE